MRNIIKSHPEFAKEYDLEPMALTIDGQDYKGWFTNFHIKGNVPRGFKAYEIRHSDNDDTIPSTLEIKVIVNHFGTFITENKTLLKERKEAEIDDWDFPCEEDEEGHQIVETCYGEVMLKPTCDGMASECYIGDNYDDYVGVIDVSFETDDIDLVERLLSEIM